jgi:group I intron endonuclease
MIKTGIYRISSLIDNRIYIGSTIDFEKRKSAHLFHLKKGSHHSILLQRFFVKYGIEFLLFEIIEECEKSFLIKREQFYIDLLNPFFNISNIAGRVVHDDKFKKDLSERNKKRIWTEESKLKSSESKKGKKQSIKFLEIIKK